MKRFIIVLIAFLIHCSISGDPCLGQRSPIPKFSETRKFNGLIDDMFKKRISQAKASSDLVVIAGELRTLASESTDNKPQQYCLLDRAIELAGLASAPELGVELVDLLADDFDLKRGEKIHDMFRECFSGKRSANEQSALAAVIGSEIDNEISKRDMDYLRKLAALGYKAASKARDTTATQRFKEYRKKISALAKLESDLSKAREDIQSDPNNPKANLLLGAHYCFLEKDWETGLDFLAKAPEPLGNIAKLELTAFEDTEKHLELARAWAKYSDTTKLYREESAERARIWYERALKGLNGIEKKLAEVELRKLTPSLPVISRPRISEKYVISASDDNTIRVWDVKTGKDVHVNTQSRSDINVVRMSPAGGAYASGGDDNIVNIWDLKSGKNKFRMLGHTGDVKALAYSPDGKFLASGDTRGSVQIWSTDSGEQTREIKLPSSTVWSLDWHPGGSRLAAAMGNGSLQVMDPETGEIDSIDAHPGRSCRAVRYSPKGDKLATGGSDNAVRMWDPFTGASIGGIAAHTRGITCLDFSPDGRHIVTASDDYRIRVWTTVGARPVVEMKGHKSYVVSLRYSPSGRLIASGSFDDTVILWDAKTGRQSAIYHEHLENVWGVDFGF